MADENKNYWRSAEAGPIVGDELPTAGDAGKIVVVKSDGRLGFEAGGGGQGVVWNTTHTIGSVSANSTQAETVDATGEGFDSTRPLVCNPTNGLPSGLFVAYCYLQDDDTIRLGIGNATTGNLGPYSDIPFEFSQPGGGAVSSVFGRTGAVVAVTDDYDASQVNNDSDVTGDTVKDALETLLAGQAPEPVQEFWVDKNNTGDVANGSKVSPFTTVGEANAAITDGPEGVAYCVRIAAATYTAEEFTGATAFPSGKTVVYIGDGFQNTVIGKADVAHDWALSGDTRLTLQGLTLKGSIGVTDGEDAPANPATFTLDMATIESDSGNGLIQSGAYKLNFVVKNNVANVNYATVTAGDIPKLSVSVQVTRGIILNNAYWTAGAVTAESGMLTNCNMQASLSLSGPNVSLVGTYINAAVTFSGGPGLLYLDAYSSYWAFRNGIVITNGSIVEAGKVQTITYNVQSGNRAAYQTIQAALDAADDSSATQIIIECAPGTYTENLDIPTGKDYTIIFPNLAAYTNVIDGTITWNAAGNSLILCNVEVYGLISGVATATSDLEIRRCYCDAGITFTGSAVHIAGNGSVGTACYAQGYGGNISTTGRVSLLNMSVSNITAGNTAEGIILRSCNIDGGAVFTCGGTLIRVADCDVNGAAQSFVFSGAAGTVYVDGWTKSQFVDNSTPAPTNGAFSLRDGS